jgi:cell division septation protein DedD
VKFVRVTERDLFGAAPLEVARDDLPPPAWSTPPAASNGTLASAVDTVAVDTSAAITAADSTAAAATESLRVAAASPDTAAAPEPTAVANPDSSGRTASAPAEPPTRAAADAAGFDMAPYTVPVGRDGWALQVYAFRDSASAAVETAILGRRGMQAAARQVDVPGKGLWWRVYVGSFASRAEARRAMPALYEKLRIDWANPTRFPD